MVDATTTEQVTAWATVGLGVGTLALAGIGTWQAKLTRRAITAADRETAEATKARIDQRAPLVTFTAVEPARHTAEWLIDLEPNLRFDLARHAWATFGVSGWFCAVNEGRSTAIVDIPPGAFVTQDGPDNLAFFQVSQSPRPPDHQQFPLRPGDARYLFVEARRTLPEWIESGSDRTSVVTVVVEDTFEEGVRDTTELCIVGTPLALTTQNDAVSLPTNTALIVRRTKRQHQR